MGQIPKKATALQSDPDPAAIDEVALGESRK